jgi:phage I-like protein
MLARGFFQSDLDAVPEWVHVLPAASQRGEDGRSIKITDLPAIVERTLARATRVAVDVDHEIAKDGGSAIGWAAEYEIRETGLWARIEWTDRGRELIATKAYRYVSPGVEYDGKTGETLLLFEIALTNLPNLTLSALFSADRGDKKMDLEKILAALRAAVGGFEGAPEELLAEIAKRCAKPAAPPAPDLHAYVPRADYDQLAARVTLAEKELQARREQEIDSALDSAIKGGKIAPASRDYHKAQCLTPGGVERFQLFVATAPSAFAPRVSGAAQAAGGNDELEAFRARLCRAGGIDREKFDAAAKRIKEIG